MRYGCLPTVVLLVVATVVVHKKYDDLGWHTRRLSSGQVDPRTVEMKSPPPARQQFLKLPLPIIVTSLPKSGTTSAHQYFLCGGQKSIHHVMDTCIRTTSSEECTTFVADCVHDNVKFRKPFFQGCGNADIWSDIGYENKERCYHPSLSSLQAIYDSYPRATFLHIVRDVPSWLESVRTFGNGWIAKSWKKCKSFDATFPLGRGTKNYTRVLEKFYEEHTLQIRRFANSHPTLTYVEVHLDDLGAGLKLEQATGISHTCWGHANSREEIAAREVKHKGRTSPKRSI